MLKNITCIGALLVTTISFAQTNESWCGANQITEKQFAEDPGLREVFHQSMMNAAQGRGNTISNRSTLVVPVVVHIIHSNGVGNITNDQVMSALEVLNNDYNRANADSSSTRNTVNAPFKPNAGSMDIQFKLAKIDPEGECTSGIVRVNAPHLTFSAGEACKYTSNGGSDIWNKSKYLNIWVVNSIESDGAGSTLGYAYYPYGNAGGSGYGVLIRNDYFGTIGTASNSDGRTLTHELGHALGLAHIFDGGWGGNDGCHTGNCSSNGDYACDTPPQMEANWSCSQTWNSCSEIPLNDTYGIDAYDQIENYMSYNYCQNMFSMDQVAIMQANFADIGFLSSMVSPANLIATGVNEPDYLCTADFDSYKRNVCVGTVVNFTDYTFHGPTDWTWTISGTEGVDYAYVNGTSSTSQHPSVEFLSSGYFDIQLVATDGVTSDGEFKSDFITVVPAPAALPYIEGFEPYDSFANTINWDTYSATGPEFEVVTGIARTDARSARLLNFGQSSGKSAELISPAVDLSVIDTTESVTMTFRYAYKKRFSSNDEWLKVFITPNCGANWAQRRTIHGDMLSPLTQNSAFVPTSASDWTTVHLTNITQGYMTDQFRYKFEFEGDNGNNFYIDDINIYEGPPSEAIVGLDVVGDNIESMSVYPNPTGGNVNLRFSVENGGLTAISIVDVTGKQLDQLTIFANAGSNLIELATDRFAAGVYFIKVSMGGATSVQQLVVE